MKGERVYGLWERLGILAVLMFLVLILCTIEPDFRRISNLLNILRQSSFVGIAAVGMSFAIISGGFDLSVGSTLALVACAVVTMVPLAGLPFAILMACGLGFLVGVTNGLIITKIGIPAFITTLGMMWLLKGTAYILTGGRPLRLQEPGFTFMGGGSIGQIPVPFAVMIMCYFLAFVILRCTPFGRRVNAIGSNERAAVVCGINVDVTRILSFALVGFFTAISAVLLSARLWSANPNMGAGFELSVIATVVLGGTSLRGGSGTLSGTFSAAILIAVINNALNLLAVGTYWQKVALGVVLLIALSVDGIRVRLTGQERG